jgi:[acyl-carrier-protein] S-malonyltransferase
VVPEEGVEMSLGMIFPGQGSQSVGMLAELAAHEPVLRLTFDEASDVLGYDLWRITQEGPEESLNSTDITQPALLTAGVAVYRVWKNHQGAVPDIMAGHSLGEYTALVCAGALQFRDAVGLVRSRGKLMQDAVAAGEGAMAAILGLSDDQVVEACVSAADGQVVEPVNFNSPGQVVIAGDTDAVDRAVHAAKERGARRAVLLPVSVPSHCSLMVGAAKQLSERLASTHIVGPEIPVVHNVDAATHPDPDDIRTSLARQLHQPVLWARCVLAMKEKGADQLVEVGPGRVLTGLTRRIDKEIKTFAVFDPDNLSAALTELA